jgi:replicative DNA helicase
VIDRLPPQNIDSEQAVLGSILIDRDAIIEVADFLRPEHFYRQAHGRIYAAMLSLYEKREPVDVVTLAEVLERDGELESVGGPSYLSQLGNDTPMAVYAVQYGRIVERKAILRNLIQVGGRIAAIGYEDGPDAQVAIDRAEAALFEVSKQRASHGVSHIAPLLHIAYDTIEELRTHRGEILGVPTGLWDLDELTGGFQPGELIILAARPSVGKSSIALQVGSYAARHNRYTGVFSLEMGRDQLTMRLVSGTAGVDGDRLRSGYASNDEYSLVAEAMNSLSQLPIYIDDTPSLTVTELRTRARRLQMEHGLDLLIVDYLQLMTSVANHNGSRVQEVSEISAGLKALARELNVPLLALSQLNRRPEASDTGEPRLSDLRDSGSLEQDADVVLLMWREREADVVSEGELVNLRLAKNRNGPIGLVKLWFLRAQTRFVLASNRDG